MTWICEFCGRENHQSDRIALKEPACIRCGNRRGSKDKRIAKLESRLASLVDDDRHYANRIRELEDLNLSLQDELAANAAEHDSLLDTREENRKDLIRVREKLKALKELDTGGRLITADQRTLIKVDP